MSTDKTVTADQSRNVARAYANITPLALRYWGPDLHYGFWEGPQDQASIEAAVTRLTTIVIGRLGVGRGDRVLDLGCGRGRPAAEVARTTGAHVTAVDLDQDAVRAAAGHAHRTGVGELVEATWCDAREMPFPPGTFDAVLSFESTPHFDIAELYPRIARILRPGGRLVVETPILLEPMTAALEERVRDFFELLHIGSFETADAHRDTAERSGLTVTELVDITPNVNGSFGRLTQRLRRHEDELREMYGAAEAARLIDLFDGWGRRTEVGAMIMVAESKERR